MAEKSYQMLNKVIINGIDVTSYKKHARILELKFVYLFEAMANDFGVNTANDITEGLSQALMCDVTKLRVVASKAKEIKKFHKRTTARYVQELLFMGELYGESTQVATLKYVHMTLRSIYGKDIFKKELFVTKEWLAELDNEAVVCGIPAYRIELERFVDLSLRLKDTL